MGNCLLLLGLKKEKRPVTLLLVGLDSAGKTTAAKGIVGDPAEDVAPTVGFAPEYLEYRGCEVTIYDLGGGAKIRPVWAKYFSEVHGVIFVVDSSAGGRMEECRSVLMALLADPKIAGKPVLILANKQDVEGAMDEIDLVEGLKVEEIVNRYKCPTRVETCSALATRNRKPDKPIADGFRWLVDTIVVHYKEINSRVTKDLEKEREEQRREMEERKERLRQLRAQREAMAGGRSEVPPLQDAPLTAAASSSSSPPTSPLPGSSPLPSSSSSPSSSPPASSVITKAEVLVREGKEEEEEEEKEEEEDEEGAVEKVTCSNLPNGSLPQGKGRGGKHRTSATERQELKELGFESSGELAGSSTSSTSSTSSSSSLKVPASTQADPHHSTTTTTTTTTTATLPGPHRVILVRESSPSPTHHHHNTITTTTTAATTTSSPSTTSIASSGHRASKLDLSSERRQSECIPIDSDDDMFDLSSCDLPPATTTLHHLHHHHHHQQNNYLHHTDNGGLVNGSANTGSNNNNSSSHLELEGATKPSKKKSFLKRYHKTAPLVTRDQEVPPQHA